MRDVAMADQGTMIVVVGPSGAGKDSVMAFAARRFAGDDRILFARRVITRAADAGGEAHESVSAAEFASMRRSGSFCVSWDAHGLSYGIPAVVRDAVAGGRTVIANGSRQALPSFAAAFPRLKVVVITAHPEVLAERLAARGRETREAIAARLGRKAEAGREAADVTTLDNSGALEIAGEAFVRLVGEALHPASSSARLARGRTG
ncbi:phosphonate metabolism protein/1,5-bisphosphokinase (PRPP-forming) PhnN [Sinorhizobium sp. BG8]|uniref:phosphonate metabolism protein/1,5-bisphosphokinase (PRPP-forming) PhnN n=1 Tax=Sinorhizobium sp. BG8 TaxID=2613773 RepID=UPI00193E152D|nr:phosphonate metabolism protein/1,5-bisphosphokinase (PRPP-forming) PhnN [Sinorhizobium sp. BG8]QRM54331.1 phosphonate metabolism protein/1,5-bisphosphokinase (PRPP-forming) PhnN [Sinorhizobium sp. BG8]